MNVAAAQMPDAKARLTQEMKVTKGCRFNAAKRLEGLEKRRTVVIAAASILVIALSLIPALVPVHIILTNTLVLITVCLSIIILTASIMQTSNADAVKADQLHRCALEINSLRRELLDRTSAEADTVATFSRRYDEILRHYTVNHDDVDFEKYKLEHPAEYPTLSPAEKSAVEKDVKLGLRPFERLVTAVFFVAAMAALGALASAPLDTLSRIVFPSIFAPSK